jgi:hypothetical protein
VIKVTIDGDLRATTEFPVVPRVGEYIEWGPDRTYCVKSVHYQGNYPGAVIMVEFTPPRVYDMIRGIK